MSDLGLRIRELRLARGLSVGELARRAGVTSSAVSQWEGKQVKGLKGSTLIRVAEALGVEPGALLTNETPAASLASDEAELLQIYRDLPPGHRVLALRVLKALK